MDAVGTVIQPSPSVAEAYMAAGQAHGIDLDRETIRQRFRQAISKYSVHAFQTQRGASDPLRTDETTEIARWKAIVYFVLTPQPSQQESLFEELWNHFGKANHWSLFEDVSPALSLLADAGFSLGLASNFDHRLRPIVEHHLSAFDLKLFISSEVGWVKPAASFYQYVTDALKCQPHEILLMGDDWKNDVESPRNFGWQTMYLARSGQSEKADISSSFPTLTTAADALLER